MEINQSTTILWYMIPRSRAGEGRKKYLEIEDPAEHKQRLDVLTLFHSMKVGNLQVQVIAINPLVIIALDAIIFHFPTPTEPLAFSPPPFCLPIYPNSVSIVPTISPPSPRQYTHPLNS
jgi:hypothetical protein